MTASTYVGRIASVPDNNGFGFVGIGSVTKTDGSNHNLKTEHDIFIHQDECSVPLRVGLEVSFEAVPEELVAQVIANRPAPEIPRESGPVPNPEEILRRFLLHLYCIRLSSYSELISMP